MARVADSDEAWRSRSPYAERGDVRIAPLDFALTRTFGGLLARLENYAGRLAARVKLADACAASFSGLSDEELADAAKRMRGPLLRHGFRPDLVAQSFALVRETTFRKLGIRHHAVQLMGAWAMIDGRFSPRSPPRCRGGPFTSSRSMTISPRATPKSSGRSIARSA